MKSETLHKIIFSVKNYTQKLHKLTMHPLLLDRAIVIDEYPNSSFKRGSIILTDEINEGNYLLEFPNLFRKIKWWEYRTPEQMPTHVMKTTHNDGYYLEGDYLVVHYWVYDKERSMPNDKCKSNWFAVVSNNYINAEKLIPVTIEQYDAANKENKPTMYNIDKKNQ
jgi:hypothetical protein